MARASEITDERLLTTGDVAGVLRVHPDTVARLVADGTLPAYRVGRQIRFRPEDLRRALDDGLVKPRFRMTDSDIRDMAADWKPDFGGSR